jgi:DNA-binding transcriptional ArsR family regulator
MPEPDGAAPLYLDNPRTIRALAHPARLAIIDALASGDELTATQCAELTGLSPSATAYHLNFLQRYGFAEPAPARPDRRERPWRANRHGTSLDVDTSTPAATAATSALVSAHFDRTRAVGLEFLAGGDAEPEEWRDHAALRNADLWMTADEMRRVAEQFEAVLRPLRDREVVGERPAGSRRVRVMNVVVPYAKGRDGGGPEQA